MVEILVVVAIIIVLAALSFNVIGRGIKKAEAAKSVANLREIGAMLAGFAVENSNRLPAPRAKLDPSTDSEGYLYWFEALLSDSRTDLEPEDWRNDEWWLTNKPVLLNPLINEKSKPKAFAWSNPGYAFNRQIILNLKPSGIDTSWTEGENSPQNYEIPLGAIPDPLRTPIIAPRADWHYSYAAEEASEPGLAELLVDGQMPILFIDGHVERMTIKDYVQRELDKMPLEDPEE